MSRQIDWTKICLLLIVILGGGYAAKEKLGLEFPELNLDSPGSAVSIPDPSEELKSAVQPLVTARATNPRAAKVVSDFLASYAFVIENSDVRDNYNSSALMRNIESGLESLFVLQKEVGDIDIGDALNESLQAIWGDRTKQLTKAEAANGIYACAWGLQVQVSS